MVAKVIDINDIQAQLGEILALVIAGNEVVLTQHQKPVVRLVPVSEEQTQRIAGLHSGAIWASADFDEPLPEAFWTGEI